MADKTGIEWTDATWNPIRGCSRVSEGCRNCYAETVAGRFSGPGLPYEGLIAKGGQWNGNITLVPGLLDQPLRWRRPRRIFVNSMSDLFHENVPDDFIDKVFAVMALAPQHTFQVLTKRPDRMLEYLTKRTDPTGVLPVRFASAEFSSKAGYSTYPWRFPLPNVWLGVSAEDQKTADERIPLLLQTPAAVRWISAEPMLGPINLEMYFEQWPDHNGVRVVQGYPGLDWVVVGGESGSEARPMHPDWASSLRDQCKDADVPFLFKQWGEWLPVDCPWEQDSPAPLANNERWMNADGGHGFHGKQVWRMRRLGKKRTGRLLDGVQHDEYPKSAAAQGGGV